MSSEHYFSTSPSGDAVLRTISVRLAGRDVEVTTANGIFSPDRVDVGTQVLLGNTPAPPPGGHFLDLGCGWGPITLTLALDSPHATVWAVDVGDDMEAPPSFAGARLDELERTAIVATLQRCDGNRAKAAEALGIGVRTLSGKLRAYGYAPRTKEFDDARGGSFRQNLPMCQSSWRIQSLSLLKTRRCTRSNYPLQQQIYPSRQLFTKNEVNGRWQQAPTWRIVNPLKQVFPC